MAGGETGAAFIGPDGGVRRADATPSELVAILRRFPSVGPPPHCPCPSTLG